MGWDHHMTVRDSRPEPGKCLSWETSLVYGAESQALRQWRLGPLWLCFLCHLEQVSCLSCPP